MKLDSNCVRAVLLELEKLSFQENISIENLSSALPNYPKEEVSYCCFKLREADYIDMEVINSITSSGPSIRAIKDITYSGHEFLNNIRSEYVWNNVKNIGTKIGANSLGALTQIASGVISALIKSQLGL